MWLCNILRFTSCRHHQMSPQDALGRHSPDLNDSSTDDDNASQTTEDDPQVPQHEQPPPQAPPPPVASAPPPPRPSAPARERPHYELRHTLRGHTHSISAVKFSPDGTLLASCGNQNAVKLWSPHTGELIRNLNGHTKGLSDITWSADSAYLASASDDTTIRVWEVDTVGSICRIHCSLTLSSSLQGNHSQDFERAFARSLFFEL